MCFLAGCKVKSKVTVYSLISTCKAHAQPTSLTPGHWACSVIIHLNSPGSIQASQPYRRRQLYSHKYHLALTGTHLTPGWRGAMSAKCLAQGHTRKTPGGAGNRTGDLPISTPTLYRLSYDRPVLRQALNLIYCTI